MIVKVAVRFAACSLSFCSLPVFAAPAAPLAPVTTAMPARMALARELIGYTQPKELMLQAVLHGWELGVAEQDRSQTDKLDAIEPGLSTRLIERGKSEIVALVAESIPQMHEQLTRLYADNCNEDELKGLIAFYSSPAGRKLVRSMTMAAKGGEAFDDEKVTTAEATKANREAAKDAIGELDGDEWIAAAKFGVSPSGQVVKKLAPQVQAISAEWMTRLMADFGKRMEPITEKLVMQAFEKADKKPDSN